MSLLETILRDGHSEPRRYTTPQGPVVFFQRVDHVAAVLAEPTLSRTNLLPWAFGGGIVVAEYDPKGQAYSLLKKQFGAKLVRNFLHHSSEVFAEELERWRGGNGEVYLDREFNRMTLETVFRSVVSQPLGDLSDKLQRAVTLAMEFVGLGAKLALGEECLLPPGFTRTIQEAKSLLDEVAFSVIHSRQRMSSPPDDLLTLLVQSKLSESEIRDELISFLLAGAETSSLTLSWTCVELRHRSDLVARLREEADRVLGDAPATLEGVAQLKLARAVVDETLRLYPSVWQLTRRAMQDVEICGEAVAAGTLVVVSPYTVHRDAQNWSRPNEYDPERFLGANAENAKGYIPFSSGHHVCLGRKPALVEVTLLTALLAQRTEIELLNDDFPPSQNLGSLRHAEPLRARLTVR